MARCEECLHYELCSYNAYEQAKYFGKDKEIYITIKNNTTCKFFKPTADVVPKSEVENLKVLLEMKDVAYEGLKELYDTDTEALIKVREKTEVEIAREIFAELDEFIVTRVCYVYGQVYDISDKYVELKKKYMREGE